MDKRFALFMIKEKNSKKIFNCWSPFSFDLIAFLTVSFTFFLLSKTVALHG